jgi:hypothetical protein
MSHLNPLLTREEKLAFELARRWQESDYLPDLSGLDWDRLAVILSHNRMSVLAMQVFNRAGLAGQIPFVAKSKLLEQTEKFERAAYKLGSALTAYLNSASIQNIGTIVLKGLWLCNKIYQNPSMRPGGDIDILVRRAQVDTCIALLKQQGVGEFWPNLLHDEYFSRHHLHQQRSTSDLNIWFEIHWAFDHPYTLLTVDYESIFERAKPGILLGAPVQEMSLPDLLLSLSIHLVKHAVYLPSLVERQDLPRIILADGMLMYYLDITEVLKQNPDRIDWEQTMQLARDWGVVDILASTLLTSKRYLDGPVPENVFAVLSAGKPWYVTRKLMARAAKQKVDAYLELPEDRFWKLLLSSNGAFILRPVRLLETASYFFPPADYLIRRYGRASLGKRIYHLIKAIGQTLRFGSDSIYFGLERYYRLKRMGKSASLFNKLETDL